MESSEIVEDKLKERIEKCLLNFRKAEGIILIQKMDGK